MTDPDVIERARSLWATYQQLQSMHLAPERSVDLVAWQLARLVPDLLAVIDGQEVVLRRVAWLTAADELSELDDDAMVTAGQIRAALHGEIDKEVSS